MSDLRLRELERRAVQGDPGAEARFLREGVRQGELTPITLQQMEADLEEFLREEFPGLIIDSPAYSTRVSGETYVQSIFFNLEFVGSFFSSKAYLYRLGPGPPKPPLTQELVENILTDLREKLPYDFADYLH